MLTETEERAHHPEPRSLDEPRVGGTLVWYYCICHREVWLMGHQINPDEDDPNIELGRFISEHSYARERKEVEFGGSKFDVVTIKGGRVILSEVKKSSRSLPSARMQLAFYLSELKSRGIEATGELRIPQEKRRETVVLDAETEAHVKRVVNDILRILYLKDPPEPKRISFCRSCAYREFCWS